MAEVIKEIEEFINSHISALLGLSSIVNLLFILTKVLSKKIKGVKIFSFNKIADKYFSQLNNPEYLDFQKAILKEYYKDYWTDIQGKSYPVYTFEGLQCPFSVGLLEFEGLHDAKELDFENKFPNIKKKYYWDYWFILEASGKVTRPKMIGFMLNKLSFNNEKKINHFTAWKGTYAQNLYTSHILEHELFKMFKKHKEFTLDKYNKKIKNNLVIRNKIHNNKTIEEVLSTGCNRASLLGVQLVIIYKTHQDKYEVIICRRSDKVATKPHYYQFIPSGSFEVCDNSSNISSEELKKNFSVAYAVFREYAEELFDIEDAGGAKEIQDVKTIRVIKEVQKITNMIKEDLAFFEFLGSTVELITLRNELSFILRIDDKNYINETVFKTNHETKKGDLFFMSINQIEQKLGTESELVNPGSAGLWHLLQKNHLYREIIEDEKNSYNSK